MQLRIWRRLVVPLVFLLVIIVGSYFDTLVTAVRKAVLTPLAETDFVPWRFSEPFVCSPNLTSEMLDCDSVLLPEGVGSIEKVNGDGYQVFSHQTFSYPLENVTFCSMSSPSRVCKDEFANLDKSCIAWTALNEFPQANTGDIYLVVNCWGFQKKFSIDNHLGQAIPKEHLKFA